MNPRDLLALSILFSSGRSFQKYILIIEGQNFLMLVLKEHCDIHSARHCKLKNNVAQTPEICLS